MITFYPETKTTIDFWYRQGLKPFLFYLAFCMCFLFWKRRDIKVDQNYIYNPIFNESGLQNSN